MMKNVASWNNLALSKFLQIQCQIYEIVAIFFFWIKLVLNLQLRHFFDEIIKFWKKFGIFVNLTWNPEYTAPLKQTDKHSQTTAMVLSQPVNARPISPILV